MSSHIHSKHMRVLYVYTPLKPMCIYVWHIYFIFFLTLSKCRLFSYRCSVLLCTSEWATYQWKNISLYISYIYFSIINLLYAFLTKSTMGISWYDASNCKKSHFFILTSSFVILRLKIQCSYLLVRIRTRIIVDILIKHVILI